ncbi:MAG: 1-acyl-sn-glycerol-3-phosphate acyltransferase [Glaciecola sp.]|jgi:1-acyl-sn-glycerol-3-phosphate acyltransferase
MMSNLAPDLDVPEPARVDAAWRKIARGALKPWCRLEVSGQQHVPATGGVLIASNHLSHADSLALGLAVRKRAVSFLGDERLTETPIIGRRLKSLGMMTLRRGDADLEALERLVALLGAGHAVVVYPEGSRSRTGEVHRPRSGVARVAAMAGVPVVPAGVLGTQNLWPIDANPRPRGARVQVRFGPPSSPASNSGRDRRAFNEQLHEALVGLAGAPRADHFSPVGGVQ